MQEDKNGDRLLIKKRLQTKKIKEWLQEKGFLNAVTAFLIASDEKLWKQIRPTEGLIIKNKRFSEEMNELKTLHPLFEIKLQHENKSFRDVLFDYLNEKGDSFFQNHSKENDLVSFICEEATPSELYVLIRHPCIFECICTHGDLLQKKIISARADVKGKDHPLIKDILQEQPDSSQKRLIELFEMPNSTVKQWVFENVVDHTLVDIVKKFRTTEFGTNTGKASLFLELAESEELKEMDVSKLCKDEAIVRQLIPTVLIKLMKLNSEIFMTLIFTLNNLIYSNSNYSNNISDLVVKLIGHKECDFDFFKDIDTALQKLPCYNLVSGYLEDNFEEINIDCFVKILVIQSGLKNIIIKKCMDPRYYEIVFQILRSDLCVNPDCLDKVISNFAAVIINMFLNVKELEQALIGSGDRINQIRAVQEALAELKKLELDKKEELFKNKTKEFLEKWVGFDPINKDFLLSDQLDLDVIQEKLEKFKNFEFEKHGNLLFLLNCKNSVIKTHFEEACKRSNQLSEKVLIEILKDQETELSSEYIEKHKQLINSLLDNANAQTSYCDVFSLKSLITLLLSGRKEILERILSNPTFCLKLLTLSNSEGSFKFKEEYHEIILEMFLKDKGLTLLSEERLMPLINRLAFSILNAFCHFEKKADFLIALFKKDLVRKRIFKYIEGRHLLLLVDMQDEEVIDIILSEKFYSQFPFYRSYYSFIEESIIFLDHPKIFNHIFESDIRIERAFQYVDKNKLYALFISMKDEKMIDRLLSYHQLIKLSLLIDDKDLLEKLFKNNSSVVNCIISQPHFDNVKQWWENRIKRLNRTSSLINHTVPKAKETNVPPVAPVVIPLLPKSPVPLPISISSTSHEESPSETISTTENFSSPSSAPPPPPPPPPSFSASVSKPKKGINGGGLVGLVDARKSLKSTSSDSKKENQKTNKPTSSNSFMAELSTAVKKNSAANKNGSILVEKTTQVPAKQTESFQESEGKNSASAKSSTASYGPRSLKKSQTPVPAKQTETPQAPFGPHMLKRTTTPKKEESDKETKNLSP